MVPYLESVCNPRSNSSILETGSSNGSLCINRVATLSFERYHNEKPLATIFRNVLEGNPVFQWFHIKKLVVPIVPHLETGLQQIGRAHV